MTTRTRCVSASLWHSLFHQTIKQAQVCLFSSLAHNLVQVLHVDAFDSILFDIILLFLSKRWFTEAWETMSLRRSINCTTICWLCIKVVCLHFTTLRVDNILQLLWSIKSLCFRAWCRYLRLVELVLHAFSNFNSIAVDSKWSAMPTIRLLVSWSLLGMAFKQICNALLVNLEEWDFNFTIRCQVLSSRKFLVYLINDSLDDAFVSALNHHVARYPADCRLLSTCALKCGIVSVPATWALFRTSLVQAEMEATTSLPVMTGSWRLLLQRRTSKPLVRRHQSFVFQVVGHERVFHLRDLWLVRAHISRGKLIFGLVASITMDDVLCIALHRESLARACRSIDENGTVLSI